MLGDRQAQHNLYIDIAIKNTQNTQKTQFSYMEHIYIYSFNIYDIYTSIIRIPIWKSYSFSFSIVGFKIVRFCIIFFFLNFVSKNLAGLAFCWKFGWLVGCVCVFVSLNIFFHREV